MKVLVCGTCDRNTSADWVAVFKRLKALSFNDSTQHTILHGCAIGPDVFAGMAANALGYIEERYPPLQSDLDAGRDPYHARNKRMVNQKPDLVIAFWDGKSAGTKHTINYAKKRGIPVEVIL